MTIDNTVTIGYSPPTSLHTTKLHIRQQSGSLSLSLNAASCSRASWLWAGAATAPHTHPQPMALGAEHSTCCWKGSWKARYTESIKFFKLFENIYWEVPAQSRFSLLFLCCCSHPKGPFPEPSWESIRDPSSPAKTSSVNRG